MVQLCAINRNDLKDLAMLLRIAEAVVLRVAARLFMTFSIMARRSLTFCGVSFPKRVASLSEKPAVFSLRVWIELYSFVMAV